MSDNLVEEIKYTLSYSRNLLFHNLYLSLSIELIDIVVSYYLSISKYDAIILFEHENLLRVVDVVDCRYPSNRIFHLNLHIVQDGYVISSINYLLRRIKFETIDINTKLMYENIEEVTYDKLYDKVIVKYNKFPFYNLKNVCQKHIFIYNQVYVLFLSKLFKKYNSLFDFVQTKNELSYNE